MIKNSMDWRFFLSLPLNERILVIDEDCEEYADFIENLSGKRPAYSQNFSLLTDKNTPRFNAVLIPHGMSKKDFSHETEAKNDVYGRIKQILLPDGLLLIGFNNIWRNLRNLQFDNDFSTIGNLRSDLLQNNYKSLEFYAAISELSAPDYIFPLTPMALGFVLKKKYESKPFFDFISFFLKPFFLRFLLCLLPSYYVVARASK